jgi:predicted unusual protein kinase regulating ubiquinone biosynthesis (AarF/ABC1/UbiB family)
LVTDRNKRIRIFVRLFLGIVRDFWKEARIARRLGLGAARQRMSVRHRRRAVQFRDTALTMGGVLIKLGQFFSTRVDVMPREYIEELAKLQDTVSPVAFEDIRRVIEEEFGRPLEDVFLEFEPQALAAASLAQVHKAVLPGGRAVAVKVQRPGIDRLADIDLATFSYLMTGVHRFTNIGRATDIPMIVEEFVRTIGDELDFVREASHAERFASYLDGNDGTICVPKVYWEFTTAKVLTLEAVDGIKISDYEAIEAAGIDRRRLAQQVIDSYLKQVLEDGFFHADPHPGNLFVTPGPIITFIDFGMVGELTPAMKDALREAVIGVAQKDSDRMVEALRTLGFVRPGADVRSVKSALDWLLENYSSLSASTLTFHEIEDIHEDILRILREQPLTIPAQFAFLGKTIGTMIGLATGLDPQINLVESTKPSVERLTRSIAADWPQIVLSESKSMAQLLLAMPKQLHETLERARSGQLTVKLDNDELLEVLHRSNRGRLLGAAAVFSGLMVLGAVWLIIAGLVYEGYAFVALGLISFRLAVKQS